MRRPPEGSEPMRACASLAAAALVAAFFPPPLHAQPKRFGDLHRMIPWDSDFGTAVVLGDVDGDGDLDAMTVAPIRLLLNDGPGVLFDASGQVPSGAGSTLALGDV